MKFSRALLLSGALAALATNAFAQATPAYDPSSLLLGLSQPGHRIGCYMLEPKGGDYGFFDSDKDPTTGVTRACVQAVVVVDSVGHALSGAAGGPATIADGADIALGHVGDTTATTDVGNFTLIQLTKALVKQALSSAAYHVVIDSGGPSGYTLEAGHIATVDTSTALLAAPGGSNAVVCPATASMTGTTATSLCGAPGASLRNYILQVSCVNAHATVGTLVDIEDGSGGTVISVLAGAPAFLGSSFTFPWPGLRQPTTNTAIFAQDETTGAAVKCSAAGYKGS